MVAVVASLVGSPALGCPIQIDFAGAQQGALMVGYAEPDMRITFAKHEVRIDAGTGLFAFGIQRRNAPQTGRILIVRLHGHLHAKTSRRRCRRGAATRTISQTSIERLLPPRQVTPPPDLHAAHSAVEGSTDQERRGHATTPARCHAGSVHLPPVVGRVSSQLRQPAHIERRERARRIWGSTSRSPATANAGQGSG